MAIENFDPIIIISAIKMENIPKVSLKKLRIYRFVKRFSYSIHFEHDEGDLVPSVQTILEHSWLSSRKKKIN